MRRICLTLPTDRPCAATITALAAEARYAVEHFDVTVYLLVLDSADGPARAAHARALAAVPATPNVVPLHLDEPAQRRFLDRVIRRAGVAKPELVAELMLPSGVSYGACTNRAFLIAAALGCQSVHRRDSDSRYQELAGAPVFPIRPELAYLGRRAGEVAGESAGEMAGDGSVPALGPAHAGKPVVLVGGSFVGELSVDIGEIRRLDPDVYHDVVSLWAPADAPEAEKRALVAESFTGSGAAVFQQDRAVLGVVDPMRVDMCNVSFCQVHEDLPLPPATDTIGSDYFLLHVVHNALLPGVVHNRDIVNFHTGERKTGAGFAAYQRRLAKFFLSMRYFHYIYRRLAAAGESLLDGRHRVRAGRISALVRESTWLTTGENEQRLRTLAHAYRRLGGRYAAVAADLAADRHRLLAQARQGIEDFALLIDAWEPLVRASRDTGIDQVRR